MTREEKYAIVDDLTEKLKNTEFFYITDTGGMSVAQVNDFRRACFQKGLEYKVFKNSLIKKALQNLEADFDDFYNKGVLKGFSGIIFSPESAKEPAVLIKDFQNKGKDSKLKLKGASISYGLFVGNDQVDTLVAIKSKNELIGEVIGLLQSPARNVISALQSGGQTIAGLVKTLSEKGQ